MKHVRKTVTSVLLSFVLISWLVSTGTVAVFAQQGLITIINSDITWTKAGSPYNLTGPILVSNGATLTIDAGVNVSLNGYDIGVEGTLHAIGTSDEKIYFTNGYGQIEFRPNSTPWNEQTGSGCIIEHVVGDIGLYSNVSLKVSNSVIYVGVAVEDSSIIIDSEIRYRLTAGNSNTFSYVTAGCDVTVGDSNVISNSKVSGKVLSGSSTTITGSTIDGEVTAGESSQILNNTIKGHLETSNSVISGNTLRYELTGDSVQVSNNVVYGSGLLSEGMFGFYTIPPIEVSGSSVVSGNTIYGKDETPAIKIASDRSTLIGNSIFDASIGIYAIGGGQIESNR